MPHHPDQPVHPDQPNHPIRIGAKLVPQGTTIAALRAFWRLADESGFDHLWVYDHLAGVGNAATVAEPDPGVELFGRDHLGRPRRHPGRDRLRRDPDGHGQRW